MTSGFLRHGGVVAFRQDAAAGQHGDAVAQAFHDRQIVLHHQDGAAGADAADQRHDAVHVLVRHAGRGFVQQQHLRVQRQGGGDLQRALAAVGQQHGGGLVVLLQPDVIQQGAGAVVEMAQQPFGAPEVVGRAALALQRQAHVLQRGQMREHGGDLERPHQAEPGDLRRLHAGDVAAVVADGAAGRLQELGEQVEGGGLAGAVGADQGMDGAGHHAQVDVVHGDKAAELARHTLRLQDRLDQSLFPHHRSWLVGLHIGHARARLFHCAVAVAARHTSGAPRRQDGLFVIRAV